MSKTMENIAIQLRLPPEITDVERRHVERVNRVGLWFFTAHPPVFMAVAWACGTSVVDALWMSLVVLAGPWIASRTVRNPRHLSLILAVTSMCMGGLLVHFGQGPMQIEMHFYFFVLLALLAVTGNPASILAAAATVTVHHLAFWFFLPRSVFNYDASFWVVLVHAAFVVLESVAAIYVARSFFDNVIGLDRIVRQRTAQLDERNAQLQLVLDNADQGMFTMDLDGQMSTERSRMVDVWFSAEASRGGFVEALGALDEGQGMALELSLETLREDVLPEELALEQMPREVQSSGRTLRLAYKPIREQEAIGRLLVVVTDVTDELERERMERSQRELMSVFRRVMEDRSGFLQFFGEASRIVHTLADGDPDGPEEARAEELRSLHTLKGNCGIFGVSTIADLAHDLESRSIERGESLSADERERLSEAWAAFSGQLGALLGQRAQEVIELSEREYEQLMTAVLGEVPRDALVGMLQRLRHEPTARPLMRYADAARGLARRLGKPPVVVELAHNGVRLPADRLAPFWAAFTHAVRNAVDHGIEPEAARLAAGKPAAGTVWLRTDVVGGQIVVEVADDGAGIDWAKVRARASGTGLPFDSHADLVEALFADGLSTRDEASAVSGRGVGMAALRAATLQLRGRIEVESAPGEGTTLRCSWPLAAVLEGAGRKAA